MTDYAAAFQEILARYASALEALDARSRPGDGLFGLGRRKGDDPCHDALDREVAALLTGLAGDPDAVSQASGLLRLLLEAESSRSWPDHARWMLIAVQRHGQALVPLLSPTDAASLAAWYADRYPRGTRFPVQKDLLRSLRRRGGERG